MQLPLSFQVYSGRYKNPKPLATRVNKVQNPQELLRENELEKGVEIVEIGKWGKLDC